MCFSLLIANTWCTIPGTNNTDGYEIDNTPALIVGLTVALVLILSITAPLTVSVLVTEEATAQRGVYQARGPSLTEISYTCLEIPRNLSEISEISGNLCAHARNPEISRNLGGNLREIQKSLGISRNLIEILNLLEKLSKKLYSRARDNLCSSGIRISHS